MHMDGTGAPTIGGFPVILLARPPWTDDELFPILTRVFGHKILNTGGSCPILFVKADPDGVEEQKATRAIEGVLFKPGTPRKTSGITRVVYDQTDANKAWNAKKGGV
jgi:hypothetical protein